MSDRCGVRKKMPYLKNKLLPSLLKLSYGQPEQIAVQNTDYQPTKPPLNLGFIVSTGFPSPFTTPFKQWN